MSEQGQAPGQEPETAVEATPTTPPAKTPKVFTRDSVRKTVPVQVHLPALYPGVVWKFILRLKLSADAEEKRQEFLALAPATQVEKNAQQNLNELCDLLVAVPTGFGDMPTEVGAMTPGDVFHSYVTSAEADARETLDTITSGAITLYWRKISPQEFRTEI